MHEWAGACQTDGCCRPGMCYIVVQSDARELWVKLLGAQRSYSGEELQIMHAKPTRTLRMFFSHYLVPGCCIRQQRRQWFFLVKPVVSMLSGRPNAPQQAAHPHQCARGGQALFKDAVAMSLQDGLGSGHLWYPYSYLIAALARRAAFLTSHACLLGGPPAHLAPCARQPSLHLSHAFQGDASVLPYAPCTRAPLH